MSWAELAILIPLNNQMFEVGLYLPDPDSVNLKNERRNDELVGDVSWRKCSIKLLVCRLFYNSANLFCKLSELDECVKFELITII